MYLLRREPFGLERILDSYDSMIAKMFGEKEHHINVREETDKYILEFSAPGYDKKNIEVKIEQDTIISGKQEQEKKEEQKNYIRQEFTSRSFTENYSLPANVQEAEISSTYENGILYVTLPKKELEMGKDEPIS
jgi:HSP20 family protein